MKKNVKFGLLAILFGGILLNAAAQTATAPGQLPPSFYVKAGGNDGNSGLSEENAFRTLARAIASVAEGSIRIITVIGTLDKESENSDYRGGALFYVNLENPEQVTIRGKSNALENEQALLDASGCGYKVFAIEGSSNVRFEHIGITGGTSDRGGGGIRMYGEEPVLTISQGVRLYDNKAADGGGGIIALDGKVFMEGGVISGNKSGDGASGGGVVVGDEAEFIMSGGEISGNVADWGGGLDIYGSMIMTNGNISGNTAINSGGGVYINKGAEFVMEGGRIVGNESADAGGGIALSGNAWLNNSLISNNKAQSSGGGIIVFEGASLVISGGTISGNQAQLNGGGVLVDKDCSLSMSGGAISGNQANQYGGGVLAQGNSAISGTVIINNQAVWGGGIYSEGSSSLRNCVVSKNRAFWGGAFYSGKDSQAVIINSDISENYAFSGGGGIAAFSVNNDTFLLDVKITNNRTDQGGGIYLGRGAALSIAGGIIEHNAANSGIAIYREKLSPLVLPEYYSLGNNEIFEEE